VVETKSGTSVVGLKVSETPEEVQIKAADSIVHKFKKKDIESLTKSPISLMPADLHKELTLQDLADVVEYLVSLKEAKKVKK
jgi:putative heme-binding domain-containing protein